MNKPLRVVLLLLFALTAAQGNAQIAHVEVIQNESGFHLLRDGEPYFIKGAGAKDHFDLLKSSGANSIRIWSTGRVDLLDSAAQHGMTVALGLYVRPERTGMDYNDTYAVRGQIEQLKTEILKYKDHPALLLWGIGNEMDLRYSNFKVWDTVEELAQFIKEVDPHHPTMTVIAGLDPSKAHMIKSRCPSVDILVSMPMVQLRTLRPTFENSIGTSRTSSLNGASTVRLRLHEQRGELKLSRQMGSRLTCGSADMRIGFWQI